MSQNSSPSSLKEAARRVEAELKRLLGTINDEVVPKLRQDGGKALRAAAQHMARLADSLERPPRT